MLMGQGIDKGCGCRARMKVEPIFGGVRYKKREAIAPQFVSHFHCFFERIVCFQPVICLGGVTFDPLIAGEADQGGSDGVPLAFGQGDGGERSGVVGHGSVV